MIGGPYIIEWNPKAVDASDKLQVTVELSAVRLSLSVFSSARGAFGVYDCAI